MLQICSLPAELGQTGPSPPHGPANGWGSRQSPARERKQSGEPLGEAGRGSNNQSQILIGLWPLKRSLSVNNLLVLLSC